MSPRTWWAPESIGPRQAMRIARSRREVRRAVKQARRACESHPASVRVCWDLDNTLVGTGVLLRTGRPLGDAIADARPVPNMPEFYNALRARLPFSHHFILSARTRAMRPATIEWLERHELETDDAAICFVPDVDAKLKVWRQLARDARLVIVDDLSYNHEAAEPSVYEHLVELAEQMAFIYVGVDRISEIAAGTTAAEALASEVVDALAA